MAHEERAAVRSQGHAEDTPAPQSPMERMPEELPALADVTSADIVTGATTMRRVPRDGTAQGDGTAQESATGASGAAGSPVATARTTGTGGAQAEPGARRFPGNSGNLAQRAFFGDLALRVIFVALIIALWHGLHYVLVTRNAMWSAALFPAPRQVALWIWDGFGLSYLTGTYEPPPGSAMPTDFWQALRQSDYPAAIVASIGRLLQGYLIATAIGFPLGLLVARSALVEKTIGWLSISLQALPSICWIPLALLWFGRLSVAAPILFVTVMGSLFATVVAVADGIRNVPPLMSRVGRTLGASGPRLYFSVLLPASLPSIVTGLKIGWSFAWRSLMAAELIVNSGGLGFLLQRDRDFGDAEGVLATILVIIVIGLGVQSLVFKPVERRLQALWGLTGARS